MVVVLIVGILAAVAIPLFQGRIDATKWSEGRAAMGTIANAIRAYAGEKRSEGGYGTNVPSMIALGFAAADLDGTYFDASSYSWTTAYSESANPPLTFTVTATAPAGILSPTSVTINQDGVWGETP